MKTVKSPLVLALLLAASAASADTIEYTVENIVGDRWQYNYTLVNNGPTAFDEFTVFFDVDLYDNLAVVASPLGWDSFVAQPDLNLPADGFFDSLGFLAVASGATVTGFSVAFDFLGQGTPGAQFFEMLDFASFQVIADGLTTLAVPPTPVPVPSTLGLFALGLAGVLMRRRRSRRQTDT